MVSLYMYIVHVHVCVCVRHVVKYTYMYQRMYFKYKIVLYAIIMCVILVCEWLLFSL